MIPHAVIMKILQDEIVGDGQGYPENSEREAAAIKIEEAYTSLLKHAVDSGELWFGGKRILLTWSDTLTSTNL